MSERLPYEEQLAQQWNDLPLPDENMAWTDMKRRLEEDDDRRIIPFWLRGCSLWGLVGLILLAIGWWIIRPEKWWNKKEVTEKIETIEQKEDNNPNKNTVNLNDSLQKINNNGSKTGDSTNDISKNTPVDPALKNTDTNQTNTSQKTEKNNSAESENLETKIDPPGRKQRIRKPTDPDKQTNERNRKIQTPKKAFGKEDEQIDISVAGGIKNNKKPNTDTIARVNNPADKSNDSLNITVNKTNKPDSVKNIVPDSTQKKTPELAAKKEEPKIDSTKRKRPKFTFSAGIAMQQQLPVGGQKLTPYNSLGRKGSIADYIPSIYLRMYKDDKWFLQSEFKYGAPQYNKEIEYRNEFKENVVGQDTFKTTSTAKLKKTFYHQLPLTFNYFVLPNWSIGTGIIWNRFVSAVAEQDFVRRINSGPADTLLLDAIQRDTNTSSFAKSYLHAVIETQYRWKKFSFGLRYAFGLQPYLRFNLPGGVERQERNMSLQLFIRYEFWRSKSKR